MADLCVCCPYLKKPKISEYYMICLSGNREKICSPKRENFDGPEWGGWFFGSMVDKKKIKVKRLAA
jgi:hypothetical protein